MITIIDKYNRDTKNYRNFDVLCKRNTDFISKKFY